VMTYRLDWWLAIAAGTLVTILTAVMVIVGMVASRSPGPLLFALVGIVATIGYGRAYVKLWRVRPSTRS